MKLESCIKIEHGRCEKPEDTIKKLEEVIKPLYDYRMLEEKVSDSLFWTAMFIDDMAFRSMGKGTDAVLSKAGALAEGAEWITSIDVESLPGYMTSHQDELKEPHLKIEDLISHVAGITPEVLEKIKALDLAKHWVDGYSLMTDSTLKVPIEYARLIGHPNGLASGNRLEESIVHATNEVFERRTHITVMRNRMVMPTIDIETIDNQVIRDQIDFIKGKGIEVYVKDLSFGGELPCVGAYFLDPNIPEEFQFHHFFKVGTSFNKEYALQRTFTEYAQGRRLDEFIHGKKDEQDRVLKHDFRSLRCMRDDADNFLGAFLFGFLPYKNADFMKEGELVPFDKGQNYKDCMEDIEAAKKVCKKLDKDYIVVDWSNPEIDFFVSQVIMPGYSDILPFHPTGSRALFEKWSRPDVIKAYDKIKC